MNFNQRIAFGCSSAWVKYPKHVDVMYTARHFLIQIDPVGLEPGVHSAYVYGFDANEPDKGPVCILTWFFVLKLLEHTSAHKSHVILSNLQCSEPSFEQ